MTEHTQYSGFEFPFVGAISLARRGSCLYSKMLGQLPHEFIVMHAEVLSFKTLIE